MHLQNISDDGNPPKIERRTANFVLGKARRNL